MHVARVMVHAFRLVAAVGAEDLAPALWAAVYLHDTRDNTMVTARATVPTRGRGFPTCRMC